MIEEGPHQGGVAVLGGGVEGDDPPLLPRVRVGPGGKEEGGDPGVAPRRRGVERGHLHPVPRGTIDRGTPIEEEPDGGGAPEEGGEMERAEPIRRPGRDLVPRIEQLGEEVVAPQRRRFEEVERGAPVEEGGEDILLAAVEGREDRREPLVVARGGEVAVPVEEGIDPGAVAGRDGGEEIVAIAHTANMEGTVYGGHHHSSPWHAPGWPPGVPSIFQYRDEVPMRRLLMPLAAAFLSACAAETFSPPTADHFEVVQGDSQSGAPGWPLDSLVVFRLLDDRGAPMGGVPVTWQVASGSGHLDSTDATTGLDGRITARWTLGATPGPQGLMVFTSLGPEAKIEATAQGFIATAVDVGFSYACALDPDEAAWCWGYQFANGVTLDSAGQLAHSDRPIAVAGGHQFVELGVGGEFACARTAAGEVWCWGGNHYGELGGGGATLGSTVPVQIPGLPAIRSLAVGSTHVCALAASDSTAWCWGDNDHGATTGTPGISPPTHVDPSYHFAILAAGWKYNCGVTDVGETRCWGEGAFGKLGTTGGNSSIVGPPVAGLSSAPVRLTLGDNTACAELADGADWCWGSNINGIIDPNAPASTPVAIPFALQGATSVTAGSYYLATTYLGGRIVFTGLTPITPTDFGLEGLHFKQFSANDSFCGLLGDGEVVCSADLFTGANDSSPPYGGHPMFVPAP